MTHVIIALCAFLSIRWSFANSACGSMSNYHPSGKFTWLDTLATVAINKADPSKTYANVAQMLTDALAGSLGSQSNQLVVGSIPPNLWDGSSTSLNNGISNSCSLCLLAFVNDISTLLNTGYLSNECTHGSGFVRRNCIRSMSPALVKFNSCNDPGGSSDLVPGTGARRCAHSDLVSLDVDYGIYENIVSKVLYADFSSGRLFSDAFSNLPCKSCLVSFFATLATYGTTNMISETACGSIPGRDSIFLPQCYLHAGGSIAGQGAKTITTAITALEQCLGGGFSISLHPKLDSQLRCDSNELEVLAAYSLYSPLVQCSLSDPVASFGSTTKTYSETFKTCMKNSVWGSNAFDLISDSLSSKAVTCWGCFGSLAKTLSTESLSTFTPHFVDLCTGPGKSSFHPKCVAAMSSHLDSISQCVGGYILSPAPTICSDKSFAGTLATSAYPPIIAAYIASGNPWSPINGGVSQKVSAMKIFQVSIGDYISSLSCYPCYKALVASLVESMTQSTNNRLMCLDIFSDNCLLNTFFVSNLKSFSACSGDHSLVTSKSPYICSSVEAGLIQSKSIPQIIFSLSVKQRAKSATQALFTFRKYLDSFEMDSPLACVSCLETMLVDLYKLSDSHIARCLVAEKTSDCLILPQFLDIVIEFQRCSGLEFVIDTRVDTTSSTAAPTSPPNSTTTKNYRAKTFAIGFIIILINYIIIS